MNKAHRELLASLAREAPLLPGAGAVAFIDVDSTQKRVYGYRGRTAASIQEPEVPAGGNERG